MDKAKAAVSDFMSKAGHHNTTVHERVAPAATQETIRPERHEKQTTAIDKEVHQDHYHTSVQPIQHQETLPEKHHHNAVGVEHRQFKHGNDRDVQERLQQEAAQFKDTRETAPTRKTHEVQPELGGEHHHHHIHETIQPVVQKETIQPHVVHTTVPIHEVHHNTAQHHAASSLPAMSMDDYKKQGGALSGRDERYDAFDGEPRDLSKGLGSNHSGNHHSGNHHSGSPHSANIQSSGPQSTSAQMAGQVPKQVAGARGSNNHSGFNGGPTIDAAGTDRTSHPVDATDGRQPAKPSLMQKLNPMKDADGDGKKGFMD